MPGLVPAWGRQRTSTARPRPPRAPAARRFVPFVPLQRPRREGTAVLSQDAFRAPSNLPGGTRVQKLGEVAGALSLLGLDQLVLHGVAVGGTLDGAEHADGRGLERPACQTGQHEGQPRLVALLVVYEDLVLPDVGYVDDLGPALSVEDDAPRSVRTEADGLAVLEGDQHLGPRLARGDLLEGAVVEEVAVLIDLDEGAALVVVGATERLH